MDFKEIRKLIDLMHDTALSEIEVEEAGRRIRVRRETPALAQEKARPASPEKETPPAIETKKEEQDGTVAVKSPIVGTFYKSPSPDADSYAEVGDIVKKGQVLCIVEAMKLMNEIESDVEGKVVEICVEDGTAVEYGEPLFKIEPLS